MSFIWQRDDDGAIHEHDVGDGDCDDDDKYINGYDYYC